MSGAAPGRPLLVAGAVAAGAAVTFGLVVAFTWIALVATGLGMEDPPNGPYLTLNLAGSFLAAALGGGAAASLARSALPSWLLALLLLLLSTGSLGRPAPGQPSWYPLGVALLGAAGAALGGLCVARRVRATSGGKAGAAPPGRVPG